MIEAYILAVACVLLLLAAYSIYLDTKARHILKLRPTPPPASPCEAFHVLKPLTLDYVLIDSILRTSVIYRCAGCGYHMPAVYVGRFQLAELCRTKSEVEVFNQMVKP